MTLFVVGTPIGNLADITLRGIETLKKVSVIYAEDTRRTRLLLEHFSINCPLVSLHQHSSRDKLGKIVERLKRGEVAALVSDAGTPAIADPGGELVSMARAAGVEIVPIPGVSAVTTLLSVAGLPAQRYWFVGYLPTKKGRQTLIKQIIASQETVVFFETALRLPRLFGELLALGGQEKTIVIGRELTKKFEEIKVGTVKELADSYSGRAIRGEITIVMR